MIEINNLTAASVSEKFLKGVAKNVLKGENKERKNLSIVLMSSAEMKSLNKKYRGKNKATDVLAFNQIPNSKFQIPNSVEGLGEIAICPETVKKNAKEFNVDYYEELARVLTHGILHLLGYGHEKGGKEARIMRNKEKDYLSFLELKFKI